MEASRIKPKENRVIELRSCFLPSDVERFHDVVPQNCLADLSLMIDSHVREPLHEVFINGLFKKHLVYENSNSLRKNKGRYKGTKLVGKPPIDVLEIATDIKNELVAQKLDEPSLKIMRAQINVNNNAYEFEYHAPSKGLVLVEVNGTEIGVMKESVRDKLLAGDLNFALPSTCYRSWRPQTVCVVGDVEYISL